MEKLPGVEIKFRTKEEGVTLINNLLLTGCTKSELQKHVGMFVYSHRNYDPITDRGTMVTHYGLNGKRGSKYNDCWTWREKLLIDMIG